MRWKVGMALRSEIVTADGVKFEDGGVLAFYNLTGEKSDPRSPVNGATLLVRAYARHAWVTLDCVSEE